MTYDLLVIGAGPAGYLAAERAGEAGLSVLLFEDRFVGGVCLNEGCIPTKTLLYSAKIHDAVKHGEKYGVTAEKLAIDHKKITARKNKVVKTLVTGIVSRLKKHNVVIEKGAAVITGKDEAGISVSANGRSFRGKNLLVATGSEPVIPELPGIREGLAEGSVVTNTEILSWETVPASLVVVGAGIVGLEFASYWNSLGTRVTMVDVLPRIGGAIDRTMAENLMKNCERKGITFLLSSRVTETGRGRVVVRGEAGEHTLETEKVLLSIGRRPRVRDLGLETIGLSTENGAIPVDECGLTAVPGVWAAGDVNGVSMLAHTASREAEVCVNNILGRGDRMRYDSIPSVVYTNPEVAGAGETEESAAAKGIDFVAEEISMRYSGRYLAENEGGDGVCKVLMEEKSGRLIGVHLIANASSELIYGAALMIEKGMTVDEIKKIVFPHPTVSEIIREAVFQL